MKQMSIASVEDKPGVSHHNLLKLVNLTDAQNVTDQPCVVREIALIKVNAEAAQRSQVLNVDASCTGCSIRSLLPSRQLIKYRPVPR